MSTRTSFRSRCKAGSRRNRNRRVSVDYVQDAYNPTVTIEVVESFRDFPLKMQQPEGPVTLTPEAAIQLANAIIKAANAALEGH